MKNKLQTMKRNDAKFLEK